MIDEKIKEYENSDWAKLNPQPLWFVALLKDLHKLKDHCDIYANELDFKKYKHERREKFAKEQLQPKYSLSSDGNLPPFVLVPKETYAKSEQLQPQVCPQCREVHVNAEHYLNEHCEFDDWNNIQDSLQDKLWTNNVVKYMEGYKNYKFEQLQPQQEAEPCKHNWVSSVAYKGARICTKCSTLK